MIVELYMQIHRQTDRAIFASTTGSENAAKWLPLSLVEVTPHIEGISTVSLPEWLAIREGLV
jgi:hypothetical protein